VAELRGVKSLPVSRYGEDKIRRSLSSPAAFTATRPHRRPRATNSQHVYEVRPREDKRGVDLISDALPFGRLWPAAQDRARIVFDLPNGK